MSEIVILQTRLNLNGREKARVSITFFRCKLEDKIEHFPYEYKQGGSFRRTKRRKMNESKPEIRRIPFERRRLECVVLMNGICFSNWAAEKRDYKVLKS